MSWAVIPLGCTLNGVAILVEEISDDVAVALVEHSYPYRDGADLEHVGAEPRRISITGIVRGPLWLEDLEILKSGIEDGTADTLVHPQFGTLFGKTRRLSIIHRDVEHSMARIRVEFVRGQFQSFSFAAGTSTTSAAASVDAAAASVTSAAAALE